jgi:hypothetical protein
VLVGLVAENLNKSITLTFVGGALIVLVLLIRQFSKGLEEG